MFLLHRTKYRKMKMTGSEEFKLKQLGIRIEDKKIHASIQLLIVFNGANTSQSFQIQLISFIYHRFTMCVFLSGLL